MASPDCPLEVLVKAHLLLADGHLLFKKLARQVCLQPVQMVHHCLVRNSAVVLPPIAQALPHPPLQGCRTPHGNPGYTPSRTASWAHQGSIEENSKCLVRIP
ncbi:hypothetical protein DPMN_010124 [Dreissena polymorpha]|uniref:Uncharacterized protein n=1 Tax=Dreissena polymorpha TaxID=45954 RepID=A0A9D4S0R7_DREPO|nr:hypothetical protein DPMN_010124 [Dreissena polymorpha]